MGYRPGIRPEDRSRVFDRFWRAPGASAGGTGLGLAIAHAVVKAHGGSLTLISDGRGSEFRIALPAGNSS